MVNSVDAIRIKQNNVLWIDASKSLSIRDDVCPGAWHRCDRQANTVVETHQDVRA